MIEFKYNLTNYNNVKIIPEIKQVFFIDEKKLKSSIDEFQVELEWNNMWSIEDAKQRLKDGWKLLVIEKDNKYIGWSWIDISIKKWFNLYVHKDYRNMGYGKELIYSILNLANDKGLDILYADVDDWNKNSQKLFRKCGWKIN